MTNSQRQQYGLGSFVKKAFKKVKKIAKSPLGKLGIGALALGIPWGAGGTGGFGGMFGSKSAFGRGMGFLRNRGLTTAASKLARPKGMPGNLTWSAAQAAKPSLFSRAKKGLSDFGWGKAAFLGGGLGLTALPFLGGDDEEDIVTEAWDKTPSTISNLRKQAQDYYKAAPDYLGSPFMPPKEYVMSGYYGAKDGGIIGMANGGQPAEAQAEQMLRMEYQKYRNQGGTMSYQQFKMAVLQQAQGQGPMAQGQQAPQMAAYGGRIGYNRGRVVNPGGYAGDENKLMLLWNSLKEQVNPEHWGNLLEFLSGQTGELGGLEPFTSRAKGGIVGLANGGRTGYQGGELVTDESMMAETPTGMMEENVEEVQGEPTREQLEALAMEIFQLRLEELDEEQLMVVYQAAMDQQPEEVAMQEEDIQFDPQMAQPQMAGEGGLMSLGGMEKDYRNEGGFVALGKKEKADDVPARLSKNEFVFTADAVRNAGGGDVNQGAEVMDNMMKHLESGGQISEDSQGAQGMYDNMKQLETRIA